LWVESGEHWSITASNEKVNQLAIDDSECDNTCFCFKAKQGMQTIKVSETRVLSELSVVNVLVSMKPLSVGAMLVKRDRCPTQTREKSCFLVWVLYCN